MQGGCGRAGPWRPLSSLTLVCSSSSPSLLLNLPWKTHFLLLLSEERRLTAAVGPKLEDQHQDWDQSAAARLTDCCCSSCSVAALQLQLRNGSCVLSLIVSFMAALQQVQFKSNMDENYL